MPVVFYREVQYDTNSQFSWLQRNKPLNDLDRQFTAMLPGLAFAVQLDAIGALSYNISLPVFEFQFHMLHPTSK